MSDAEWLTVPDFADALGVTASYVRDLLRDGALVAERRGERNTVQIPAGFLAEGEHGVTILTTLQGTLTMLSDAGLDDSESIEWLLAHNDELGTSPLGALREGKRAPVRRAAQTLF